MYVLMAKVTGGDGGGNAGRGHEAGASAVEEQGRGRLVDAGSRAESGEWRQVAGAGEGDDVRWRKAYTYPKREAVPVPVVQVDAFASSAPSLLHSLRLSSPSLRSLHRTLHSRCHSSSMANGTNLLSNFFSTSSPSSSHLHTPYLQTVS